MNQDLLKKKIHDYWNRASCGTDKTNKTKFSLEYYEEIEKHRYTIEPEIFSFAQFTRACEKKVLEVGIGAATDFLQWARAGAYCYGIDLTEESIEHAKKRFALYGLTATALRVADAEQLPYEDNFFDVVYSWGVIHHSPDTHQCLKEIIRVTKPGGSIKIMLYNRYSLFAFYQYLRFGAFKGKLFKSVSQILFNHQESLGTKAFTIKEIRHALAQYPVLINYIRTPVTNYDLLYYRNTLVRAGAYILACLLGWNTCGWFMMIELTKK